MVGLFFSWVLSQGVCTTVVGHCLVDDYVRGVCGGGRLSHGLIVAIDFFLCGRRRFSARVGDEGFIIEFSRWRDALSHKSLHGTG